MVTGSSNPVVISQDVQKHPRERVSFKPKLKTIRVITKDLIRDLVIPQEKSQPCLIIGEKEYERIKESARAPDDEALKKAQMEEQRKAELEDERDHRSEVDEELQQEKQELLQRAMRMRLEQEEEMRELNTRKAEMEQQLRQDQLQQVAQKEQHLAMQVEQDRQEFQRVLRTHQEQLEREKLKQELRELQQRTHAEDLRRQIQELRQQRQRERAAVIEEGRQQEQELRQHSQRLAQLRQQKLQEFRSGLPVLLPWAPRVLPGPPPSSLCILSKRDLMQGHGARSIGSLMDSFLYRATGIPDKYCAQVERRARGSAAPS
ncbi:cilia- and flagella-associated protein 45-like protein [Turdus rufiventris]|nr:cilia- and flagella-associated protein 45-like protein [Turdus rufiventris]